MLDSKNHNDPKKEVESIMGKVAELSREQVRYFEQGIKYIHKLYKVTGIDITEFESMDQYKKALAETIETEELHHALNENDELVSDTLREIFRNELKKRGEI